MIVDCFGYQDYYYENYDECISISRPRVYANNVVLGQMYIDFEGTVEIINHQTGERGEITYYVAGWSSRSKIEGKIIDANGNETYKIDGSWYDKLFAENINTNERICIFEEQENYKDFKRQFGFNHLAINLNYVNDEMKQAIGPTDTRFRNDQRFFEEGKVDEADEEKIRLEVK